MTYLELTLYIKGDKFYEYDKEPKQKQRLATDDELNQFCAILSCNKRYGAMIDITNSANSFFKAASDIAKLFPKEIHDDLFYAIKNKMRYDKVPSKLLYLILKAKEAYEYPNLALSMIKRSDLLPYCVEGALPEDMSILDIIQNVWQADVLLLSYRRFRAVYKDVYEVYVNDVIKADGTVDKSFDQVAVIHEKIIDKVQDINWKAFILDENIGLTNNNTILRYLDGMYGVVKDDMILTTVY